MTNLIIFMLLKSNYFFKVQSKTDVINIEVEQFLSKLSYISILIENIAEHFLRKNGTYLHLLINYTVKIL